MTTCRGYCLVCKRDVVKRGWFSRRRFNRWWKKHDMGCGGYTMINFH